MSVFREDPYSAFNFHVEIAALGDDAGAVTAGFSEVSGLGAEQEMIAYRNGNEPSLTPRLLPGLVKYPPLVLKRGVTGHMALWDWMDQVIKGDIRRTTVVITLLDEQRNPVVSWRVRNALPRKISGPALNANANEIAIESLELSHQGLELVD